MRYWKGDTGRPGWLRATGVALITLLTAGSTTACGLRALRFDIAFSEARGLEPGDPVTYKGVAIGRVASVKLDEEGRVIARVAIERAHRGRAYQEARFAIRKVGGLLAVGDERQIVVEDTISDPARRTPIRDGALVRGYDGILEEAWRAIEDGAAGVAAELRERVAE